MKRQSPPLVISTSVLILVLAVLAAFSGMNVMAVAQTASPTPTTTPVTNNITLQIAAWDDDTSVPLDTNDNRNDWVFIRIGTSATSDVRYVDGLRFQNVSIPPDAHIVEARLVLRYTGWKRGLPVHVKIQAENTDSARSFANSNPLASQRPLTAASVDWTITEEPTEPWFQSPDIAEVVQMVINRPDWQSGNALAIYIRSTEETEVNHYLDARSYDLQPDTAPKLEIVYETHEPVPTSTPTLTPTPTQTPTPQPGRLAIDKALPLPCNTRVSGDTQAWDNNVDSYTACHPEWPETGPEAVYRIELPYDNTDVHIQVFPEDSAQDLDIFLLAEADPATCLGAEDASLLRTGLDAGRYFVAIDGYDGAAGAFTLINTCTVHFPLALYLPVMLR